MTTPHTPGPWALSINEGWTTNPFSVTVRRRGVHQTTLANIPHRATVSPQEQEANARMIAAAPDLLEALTWVTRCACMPGPAGTTVYAIGDEHMAKARAAIAQATGETL